LLFPVKNDVKIRIPLQAQAINGLAGLPHTENSRKGRLGGGEMEKLNSRRGFGENAKEKVRREPGLKTYSSVCCNTVFYPVAALHHRTLNTPSPIVSCAPCPRKMLIGLPCRYRPSRIFVSLSPQENEQPSSRLVGFGLACFLSKEAWAHEPVDADMALTHLENMQLGRLWWTMPAISSYPQRCLGQRRLSSRASRTTWCEHGKIGMREVQVCRA
jgi:hypothetical protein